MTEDTNTMNEINNSMTPTPEQQGSGFGPIIGILIVVALIAFGGLYFWGSRMIDNDTMGDDMVYGDNFELIDTVVEDDGTMSEEEFNALLEQATPADADTTLDNALDDLQDLDNIDAELNAMEGQL